MTTQIKQKVAVFKSRENNTIRKFHMLSSFNQEIIDLEMKGDIWGFYEDEDGSVVAEDIWGDIHTDILN